MTRWACARTAKEIEAGLAWLSCADAMVVYTDRGISPGMRAAIAAAECIGIPVEFRTLGVFPEAAAEGRG